MTKQDNCNIAVIGGGPAGTACAFALAKRGVKDLVLIEADDYSRYRIGESIPPQALNLFQQLGIEEEFLAENHRPGHGTCSFWGSDKPGYNDTIMDPLGHGWHLNRAQFDAFLADKAKGQGVDVRTNTKLLFAKPLSTENQEQSGFTLTLNEGGEDAILNCNFVVDASGSSSNFARKQGSRKQHTGSLLCYSAIYQSNASSSLTHIEASELGWWYGAGLPDGNQLLCFFSDQDTLRKHNLNKAEQWQALLDDSTHTKNWLQSTEPAENIKRWAAPSFCLDNLHGDNWIAIGDAACAYDPLMSQGIVKSIGHAIEAAKAIGDVNKMQELCDAIKQQYQRYLSIRQHYYLQEQRWPDSPFWQKRQANL